MPVDRSLLPPLPGKPDWYVENAPRAVDPYQDPGYRGPVQPASVRPQPVPTLVRPEPTLLPTASALAAPLFQTVATEPEHGKGLKRMRALAGRLKH